MNNKKMKNINCVIVANIFFLLFTSPILLPYIPDKSSITLYFVVPFLDLGYSLYLLKLRIKLENIILFTTLLLVCIVYLKYILVIKIILMILAIFYLKYLTELDKFKIIYKYINLNIFFGILQFILSYMDIEKAIKIGPGNISRILYGSYATPTFTNFYPIMGLIRVSGLSTEAGFFASFLGISILLYLNEKSKKKYQIGIFLIGIIISLSKTSFFFIFALIIKRLKKILDKIPLSISIVLVYLLFIIIARKLYEINYFIPVNETWTHRFGGYKILSEMEFQEFFMPYKNIVDLTASHSNIYFLEYISKFKTFTGLSELIIHNGIVISILYFLFLKNLGLKTSGFLIITIFTFTIDVKSIAPQILLLYFYIFEIYDKNNLYSIGEIK